MSDSITRMLQERADRARTLDLAPECDKRCGWCLNSDLWRCTDWEVTDHGTTIWHYECTHIDTGVEIGLECHNTVTQEFEDEVVS